MLVVFKEQQAAFYQSVAALSGSDANERFITLTTVEEHADFYEESSEWLPLAVWGQRGFDTTLLQHKCKPEDRRPHEIFGEVFRVHIMKSGKRGEKKVVKTDGLRTTAASSSSAGPEKGQLSIKDRSESSSSSSSSTSHKKRKSKKHKKTKKHKKHCNRNDKRARDEDIALVSSRFSGCVHVLHI